MAAVKYRGPVVIASSGAVALALQGTARGFKLAVEDALLGWHKSDRLFALTVENGHAWLDLGKAWHFHDQGEV